MKTKNLIKTALFALLMFVANIVQAQNTISGSVSDADNGEAIPGANVIVIGSNTGGATDFDGNFSFSTSSDFPLTIQISSIGFGTQTIELTSADQEINIELQLGQNLDEIVISASRRPQKVLDSPQSVSIISSRDLENSANITDPIRSLVNIPGVQLQQQSANVINIEMRSGDGVFGTSTFPMLDYRNLFNPTSSSFLSYQSGLSNIDIARVEVVRGANSALYGPGVSSGIVHFLTKNPIDYPGTTVELIGGSLKTQGIALRHAWTNKNKTFGYKINARNLKGDDFNFDPNNADDNTNIAQFADTISKPGVTGGVADPTIPGTLQLSTSELYPNGKGLKTNYSNSSYNIHLEYRPSDKTNMFLSGGVNSGDGFFANSQGYGRTDGNEMWSQFRLQSGGLFAQIYTVVNDGGDDDSPTFLYNTGLSQVAKRDLTEIQIQYNFDMPGFLDSNWTIGADSRQNSQDSENTIWGRNEANDDYNISGAYIQGTMKLGSKLDLTVAGRYDNFNFLDDTGFAPRVALVYKPNEKNTFRVSYNEATVIPSALEMFIDFPVNAPSALNGILDIWLSGQSEAQTFGDPSTQTIDMTFPGLSNLPAATSSLGVPLAYFHQLAAITPVVAGGPTILDATLGAVGQGIIGLAGPAVQPLVDVMNNWFTSYSPGLTEFTGSLSPYDVFNGNAFDNYGTDTGKGRIGLLKSFEIGYKGVIGDRLVVSADFYTYERTGFTRFRALAPAYAFDASSFPSDYGNAVQAAILADPVLQATFQGAFAAQYAGAGLPLTGLDAGTVAFLGLAATPAAGFLAPDGSLPSASALGLGTLALFAGGYNDGFVQAGQGINGSALAQLYPIAGAIESNRAPAGGNDVHLPTGYRDFANVSRQHTGIDISMEYFLNRDWTWYANMTTLSRTDWERGDEGLPFDSYLNKPKNKWRTGLVYSPSKGFRGRISFQHDDGFYVDQGNFIQGDADEKNLFDLNIGYKFSDNFAIDISATNLFDEKYRAMPGLPVIGRRTLAKATYSF